VISGVMRISGMVFDVSVRRGRG